MWAQYNEYKAVHKQLARVKPEKRELFEQRHSRELILYDAAARYLKELKASGEEITPKEWRREIDQMCIRDSHQPQTVLPVLYRGHLCGSVR